MAIRNQKIRIIKAKVYLPKGDTVIITDITEPLYNSEINKLRSDIREKYGAKQVFFTYVEIENE